MQAPQHIFLTKPLQLRSCRFAVEDNTKRGGFWIRSETKTLQQISATISSRLRQVQIEQY